jgi:hypothetical protein
MMQDTGSMMQDARRKAQDARYRIQDAPQLNSLRSSSAKNLTGQGIQEAGCKMQDSPDLFCFRFPDEIENP